MLLLCEEDRRAAAAEKLLFCEKLRSGLLLGSSLADLEALKTFPQLVTLIRDRVNMILKFILNGTIVFLVRTSLFAPWIQNQFHKSKNNRCLACLMLPWLGQAESQMLSLNTNHFIPIQASLFVCDPCVALSWGEIEFACIGHSFSARCLGMEVAEED